MKTFKIDEIKQCRAKAFFESLREDEHDLFFGAIDDLFDGIDPDLFWKWVSRIQNLTGMSREESRVLLNYIVDEMEEEDFINIA